MGFYYAYLSIFNVDTCIQLTDEFLRQLPDSVLSDTISDINLSDSRITSLGLVNLRWDKLKYVRLSGLPIEGKYAIKFQGICEVNRFRLLDIGMLILFKNQFSVLLNLRDFRKVVRASRNYLKLLQKV